MFCLCDRVADSSFKGNQEQQYEEENQQFGKEGKWTSPPTYSVLSNNSMIIHFTLLLNCINLTGLLLRTLPSLLPQNLEHWV
jgi:hypothetical protein